MSEFTVLMENVLEAGLADLSEHAPQSFTDEAEQVFRVEMDVGDMLRLSEIVRAQLVLGMGIGHCLDNVLSSILVTGVLIGRKLQAADHMREML